MISIYKQRIQSYTEISKHFKLYYIKNNKKYQLDRKKKLYEYGIQHNDIIQIINNNNNFYDNQIFKTESNDNDKKVCLVQFKDINLNKLFSQKSDKRCMAIELSNYVSTNGRLWKALLSVKYNGNDLINILNEYKTDFVRYGKEYLLDRFHYDRILHGLQMPISEDELSGMSSIDY